MKNTWVFSFFYVKEEAIAYIFQLDINIVRFLCDIIKL